MKLSKVKPSIYRWCAHTPTQSDMKYPHIEAWRVINKTIRQQNQDKTQEELEQILATEFYRFLSGGEDEWRSYEYVHREPLPSKQRTRKPAALPAYGQAWRAHVAKIRAAHPDTAKDELRNILVSEYWRFSQMENWEQYEYSSK